LSWLDFYINPFGRISRKALWLAFLLPYLVITYGSMYVDEKLLSEASFEILGIEYGYVSLTALILFIWPWLVTSIKRFHDIDMSGWWNVFYVPGFIWFPDPLSGVKYPMPLVFIWWISFAVSLVLGLMQLFKAGRFGPNKYGPDPLEHV